MDFIFRIAVAERGVAWSRHLKSERIHRRRPPVADKFLVPVCDRRDAVEFLLRERRYL